MNQPIIVSMFSRDTKDIATRESLSEYKGPPLINDESVLSGASFFGQVDEPFIHHFVALRNVVRSAISCGESC